MGGIMSVVRFVRKPPAGKFDHGPVGGVFAQGGLLMLLFPIPPSLTWAMLASLQRSLLRLLLLQLLLLLLLRLLLLLLLLLLR